MKTRKMIYPKDEKPVGVRARPAALGQGIRGKRIRGAS